MAERARCTSCKGEKLRTAEHFASFASGELKKGCRKCEESRKAKKLGNKENTRPNPAGTTGTYAAIDGAAPDEEDEAEDGDFKNHVRSLAPPCNGHNRSNRSNSRRSSLLEHSLSNTLANKCLPLPGHDAKFRKKRGRRSRSQCAGGAFTIRIV